jgi:uncharacterized membrane protein
MDKRNKIITFLAYTFGLIALLAIIVDDKKDKQFTFHIWQAFFLNLLISIILTLFATLLLPHFILTAAIDNRTKVFLWLVILPTFTIFILLIFLGLIAASGIKLEIPLLTNLAKKIATQEKK